MTIFEQINKIDLEEILKKVGIKYKKVMGTLNLFEGNNITDGRKGNIEKGIVTDFTGKRATGDRITFLMNYFKLEKKDIVDWYKHNFNLLDDVIDTPKQYNIIKSKWELLPNITQEQKEYIKSRSIDPDKINGLVKDDNGMMAIRIYNEKGQQITIQKRSITEKKFMIEAGTESKGVYMGSINSNNKKVYVVEGMFDFLSLVQYENNVVGLKSVHDGIEVVKEMYKKGYEIILIPDNDEAGKTVIEKFSDIKYSLFDLEKYNVKDINELLVNKELGKDIIGLIEEGRIKLKSNLELAFENLKQIQKVVKIRGKRGYDGPFACIDKYTQGIIEGKVYTIGAFSNVGKSQLAYEYVAYFIKLQKKVMFISTEVGSGDLLAYISRNYYRINYYDIINGKKEINLDDFKKLTLFDNINNFEEIKNKYIEYKPDIIFIDYIQSISGPGSNEYEKMSNIAISMQTLARENNITIFSLSQVNNDSRSKDGLNITLKGSGGLFAASDVIMGLYRDNQVIKLAITKNKFGPAFKIFDLEIDFNIGEIKMAEVTENNNI